MPSISCGVKATAVRKVPKPCTTWPLLLTHSSHTGLLAVSRTCEPLSPQGLCTHCSPGLERSPSTCSRGSRLLFAQASAHVFTEAFLGATPFKWPALPRYHGASHHLPSLCLTSMSPPLCTVSSMSGDTESPAPGAGQGTRLEMSHSRILFQRRFGRCKTQRRQEWASEQAGTGCGWATWELCPLFPRRGQHR